MDFIKYLNDESFLLKFSIIFSLCFLSLLIILCIIYIAINRTKKSTTITTKDITFGAISLAIAFALSFIGFKMPQGGTVTPASSLPIMIYCYYFNFKKGLIVCISYTFLQFLQSPYIVHPMSAALDYVIPYLALSFFAIFSPSKQKNKANKILNENEKMQTEEYELSTLNENSQTSCTSNTSNSTNAYHTNRTQSIFFSFIKTHYKFLIAGLLYIIVRYFSHVLSGVIFYSEWAWEDWAVLPYSLAYNSFIVIDAAISIVIGFLILKSQAFDRLMRTSSNTLQNTNTSTKHNQ